MKRVTMILMALCFAGFGAFSQTKEVGVSFGTCNFLGDLGKKDPDGKFYFSDVNSSFFRPAVGAFYRVGFNNWISAKATLTYGRLYGDDRMTDYKEIQDADWFRNYRNLHFKSPVLEGALMAEVHLLPYAAGSTRLRIAPYITAGIGLFYYNPKAEYNGEWVSLRNIGTEGQGMPGYANKYSLIQPSFPIGFGLKYNVTRELTVTIEFAHRFTFSDYLDDVSNKYPDKADIDAFYGKERAKMVYELSRRSPENDPENRYGRITQAGEQRGNPHGKDGYLFTTVSVSYVIGKSYLKEKNPFGRKNYQKYKRVMFDR
jgi:hypothetical protein